MIYGCHGKTLRRSLVRRHVKALLTSLLTGSDIEALLACTVLSSLLTACFANTPLFNVFIFSIVMLNYIRTREYEELWLLVA